MKYINPIAIYHSNCADGFSSAWAIHNKYKDEFIYHPGIYNQPPPDVTNRDVFLVDFSYTRPVIESMLETANSITILDHHKTAETELKDLLANNRLKGEIDMDRSGAMITWNHFYPNEPPPKLIEHVQDRDLWKFNLKHTREIQSNVFSYEYKFDIWDKLMNAPIDSLIKDGLAIERKHIKDINELLSVNKHFAKILGYIVPCCNLSYIHTSDAGSIMAKGYPFAFCYTYRPKGVTLSFRSSPDGIDVSKIAKLFGGGGHEKSAAASNVSHSRFRWEGELMIIE
jgi:oligoribonuclease NrnB/cAMP/cGMP phosphodiesterase (DHH superfamily)